VGRLWALSETRTAATPSVPGDQLLAEENGCPFNSLQKQAGRPKGQRTMKARISLRALKQKAGSAVVRRGRRVFVLNKRNPRWNARQG